MQVRILPGALGRVKPGRSGSRLENGGRETVGVRLLRSPPRSRRTVGVSASLSARRSPVRVRSGARSNRCPHEVGEACRILSPVARVQIPVGVRTQEKGLWRNWKRTCFARRGFGVRVPVGPRERSVGGCTAVFQTAGPGSTPGVRSKPAWWNWETRAVQNRVPQGVRVRLPRWAHNRMLGSGSPPVLGTGDRGFESLLPDFRLVAQRSARPPDTREVPGSNPGESTHHDL